MTLCTFDQLRDATASTALRVHAADAHRTRPPGWASLATRWSHTPGAEWSESGSPGVTSVAALRVSERGERDPLNRHPQFAYRWLSAHVGCPARRDDGRGSRYRICGGPIRGRIPCPSAPSRTREAYRAEASNQRGGEGRLVRLGALDDPSHRKAGPSADGGVDAVAVEGAAFSRRDSQAMTPRSILVAVFVGGALTSSLRSLAPHRLEECSTVPVCGRVT